MSDTALPKLLFTKEEAAHILGISVPSINWQLRRGPEVLPRHKVAGKIRFTLDDLQQFVDRAKVI